MKPTKDGAPTGLGGAGEGDEEEVDAEGHPEADEEVGDEESCVKPWAQGGCEDEGGVEGADF